VLLAAVEERLTHRPASRKENITVHQQVWLRNLRSEPPHIIEKLPVLTDVRDPYEARPVGLPLP